MNDPKPGSDEAIARGCRCPAEDNRRGEGCTTLRGNDVPDDLRGIVYVVHPNCPLHGNPMVSRLMEAIGV